MNSSLWTPGGEHEVPRESAAQPSSEPAEQAAAGAAMPGAPSFDDLSPEQQAQAEAMAQELAEARSRIAEAPASTVVANHVMGLYELAAIHLSQDPPNLGEAKVAIDAMGAVIDALDGRLGENEATLKEAVTQVRVAFVQLSDDAKAGNATTE